MQEVTDELDLGERAAIALAGAIHADLLLIDEAAGRAEATKGDELLCGRGSPQVRLRSMARTMTIGFAEFVVTS